MQRCHELEGMRTDSLEKRLSDAIGRYMIDDYKAMADDFVVVV